MESRDVTMSISHFFVEDFLKILNPGEKEGLSKNACLLRFFGLHQTRLQIYTKNESSVIES